MIATILVVVLVFGYAAYVIRGMVKKKKSGQSVGCSCGCSSCSSCPSMADSSKETSKKK